MRLLSPVPCLRGMVVGQGARTRAERSSRTPPRVRAARQRAAASLIESRSAASSSGGPRLRLSPPRPRLPPEDPTAEAAAAAEYSGSSSEDSRGLEYTAEWQRLHLDARCRRTGQVYLNRFAQDTSDEIEAVLPELGSLEPCGSEIRLGDCRRCGTPSTALTGHRTAVGRDWWCGRCRMEIFCEAVTQAAARRRLTRSQWEVLERFDDFLTHALVRYTAAWRNAGPDTGAGPLLRLPS